MAGDVPPVLMLTCSWGVVCAASQALTGVQPVIVCGGRQIRHTGSLSCWPGPGRTSYGRLPVSCTVEVLADISGLRLGSLPVSGKVSQKTPQ